jgi:hypothetical protein
MDAPLKTNDDDDQDEEGTEEEATSNGEVTSNDDRGHDYRRPTPNTSSKAFGNSVLTTKEWSIFRNLGDVTEADAESEDDGRPRSHCRPSKRKVTWTATLGSKQMKSGIKMLLEQEEAAPFKTLVLPECISYMGPDLKKVRGFPEAELRSNAAGACALAALRCAEASRSYSKEINNICRTPLPQLEGASQEDIDQVSALFKSIQGEVAKWKSAINDASNFGAKNLSGYVQQGDGDDSPVGGKVDGRFTHQQHPSCLPSFGDASVQGRRQED